MASTPTKLTTAQKQAGMRIVRTRDSSGKVSYSEPRNVGEEERIGNELTKVQNQLKDLQTASLDQSKKQQADFARANAPSKFAAQDVGVEIPETAPKAAQVQAPSISFDQAVANLQAGGGSPEMIAQATNVLKQKYSQGLQADLATGTEAGQNLQDGLGSVSQFAQTQQESPSILGGLMEVDNNFDSIFTSFDELMSPESQRVSLIEEYQKLSKALGIQDLNEKLIDAQRIIEGTEDDIRAEVTAAGGFATESQVLAMANARNKSLIKNYNALLATRDNAMQQLNTMMQLSVQDRQFAEAEFDRKLNFGFKVAEFQQRAVDNARQTYMTLGNQMGWDTLLTQASPYEQQIIGKTLGLGAGGLQQLAQASAQQRAQQEADLSLDRQYKQAQIADIYSTISERETKTLSGKPQTAAQASAQGYADRTVESNQTISELGSKFTRLGDVVPGNRFFPNILKSSERQRYEQAQRNFVNAVLRRESGAAISPSEFENAAKQYFPQPGDKPEVVKQKERNRTTVINNLYREANVAPPVGVGSVIEYEGKSYKIGDGGEMIEI